MTDIRAKVRQQLIYYLQEALQGDESLMKEVFEAAESDGDMEAVNQELQDIITWLHTR